MPTFKQTISNILLGQKGGQNRIQIIKLLQDRPYNLNQLAEIMELNYRTIKHHVDVLMENDIVTTSKSGGYGKVFFLTPEMEENTKLFNDIAEKIEEMSRLTDATESPQFFQNVMEQTNDAVIIVDKDFHNFFWNKSAEKLFGYNLKKISGRMLNIFGDRDKAEDLLKKVKKGKNLRNYETTGVDSSGRPIDLSITIDRIKDEEGKLLGYSILSRDITERNKTRELLRKSEERYRFLYNESDSFNIIIDFEGKIKDINKSAVKKLGYRKKDIIGKSFNRLLKRKKDLDIHKLLRESLTHNKTGPIDIDILTVDGSTLSILILPGRSPLYEDEDLTGVIFTGIDITERKKMHETLRLSEKRYELTQEAANIGSWDWDLSSGKLYWSKTVEPMFGFKRGAFGRTFESFLDVVHPDDRKLVVDSVNKCIKEGKGYDIEHRLIQPGGEVIWVEGTGDVIRDDSGAPVRMLGIVRDISEWKLVDRRLRFKAKVLKNMNDAVITLDTDWKIISWNRAAEKIFKEKEKDVVGKDINDVKKNLLFKPEERAAVIKALDTEKKWHDIKTYREGTGVTIELEILVSIVKNEKGENLGIAAVIHRLN